MLGEDSVAWLPVWLLPEQLRCLAYLHGNSLSVCKQRGFSVLCLPLTDFCGGKLKVLGAPTRTQYNASNFSAPTTFLMN